MKLQWSCARVAVLLACVLVIPACDDGFRNTPINLNWFVDPVFGDDFNGDGSQFFPLRTIGRALLFTIPGDGVILATGTYSATSGEIFPLMVRPGVFVQGDPGTHGVTTVVGGAGSYTIQGGTQAGIPVMATFVMGSGSSLTGVKVTAAGASGVGIVFDGNAASVTFSTITGCGASGVRVYQSVSPTLSNNVISSNGATGITTFDSSSPNLRTDSILSNGTDGILANDTSLPNLGDTVTAGANTIQGNTGVGLNNNTTASTIQAVGNIWRVSTQLSDSSGHYAASLNPGIVVATPANNYAITNLAAAIQF